MIKGTMFEIEGWKRILAVRSIFEEAHLDIDRYKMKMIEVNLVQFTVITSVTKHQ